MNPRSTDCETDALTTTPSRRFYMVNDLGEVLVAFVAMPETKQIAQPKELNNTDINKKGAAPHRKIGLPLNSLFL